jgi:putative oxidoreductase
VVFSELFCALGVVVGLLYRLALIPMIINMSVAFFVAHGAQLTGEHNGELAFLYLMAFIVLLLTGPGKFALDNLFSAK